jgi:aminoglycoside 3-N-acetyltransferase
VDARPETEPTTRRSLAAQLRALGLAAGDVVLVHSSLRQVGWVVGGPVAVVQAIGDVVGPGGTIVVPTQVSEHSDPAEWRHPPVPEAWWPVIRAEMPGFDPLVTPSQRMGIVAETLRTWPGARRSSHPAVSFAALGAEADEIVRRHPLDHGLGDASPLGELYRRGARVLLIGVGYDRNTSFHLAQYRTPDRAEVAASAPVLERGRQLWKTYREIDFDTDAFPSIGGAFEGAGHVRTGLVGRATARLFSLPAAVEFAVAWLRAGTAPP